MSEREAYFKRLFLLAREGDEASYRIVLEGVGNLLKTYLLRTMNPRMRSMERVEDLVQEVLVSIHRKRDLYADDKPFLPWVHAIARYRFIDSLRMEKRRPETVEWLEKFDVQAMVEMPKLAEEEDGESLLEGLNTDQQEILKLAKVEGIPLNDIALKKGMSLSAVKVSIHRSLKTLRKRLEKGGLNHGE